MKKAFLEKIKHLSLVFVAGELLAVSLLAASPLLAAFNNPSKVYRNDNKQKTYINDLTEVSSISINTNNTNVNIVPSKLNKLKINYIENADEKYDISKKQNQISVIYKNNSYQGIDIPILKGGNPYKYKNNDLTIEIPESYSGDLNFFSESGNSFDYKPFLSNGPFTVKGLKNLNNLNINFSDIVNIENVSCKNNINIKTERDCNLKNVFSENLIKTNTVVGNVNLDNISSKNLLDAHSADGFIAVNSVHSDKINLSSPFDLKKA